MLSLDSDVSSFKKRLSWLFLVCSLNNVVSSVKKAVKLLGEILSGFNIALS